MRPITEQEQAAMTLQAIWRGRKSRSNHQLPKNSDYTNYPPSVSGNDADIALPRQGNNNFIFVGCSGLNNLKIIMSMITLGQIDNTHGYKYVPKLYILDSSELVYQFWMKIKECIRVSNSLALLLAKLDTHKPFFTKYCNSEHSKFTPGEYIEQLINSFADKFPSVKGDVKYEIFYFIKSLIEKATFLRVEWEDTRPFKLIRKNHPTIPIHVYASNIAEYLGFDVKSKEIEQMLSNIALLMPQTVIHTRTDAVHSQCDRLSPQRAVILNEGDVQTNRKALSSSAFIPLIKETPPVGLNQQKIRFVQVSGLQYMSVVELEALLFNGGSDNSAPPAGSSASAQKRKCFFW